ncbi:MAG TPA: carboxypeptidase regulatory-like domain-containing protein, partial [Acidobacteria bacterium]|nr:carboxypeptidase regulatory-like domain-containing protein [Acidobacteriota bacterium]
MKCHSQTRSILGIALAVAVVLLALAPAAMAAGPPMHPAGVLTPVKIGVSPVLRNMDLDAIRARANKVEPGTPETGPKEVNGKNAEMPGRIAESPEPSGAPNAPVQNTFGPNAMPPDIVNFDGVGNVDGVLPPDTNGDVGVSYYVQWVNLSFDIFNKADGTSAIGGPVPGNTLWTGFGGSCESNNAGDPIVLYDSLAGRWFMSQFTMDNHQCIAVSTSGDPTGSWYLYDYLMDAGMGDFPDYPKFGVWPDGYYYTANMFGSSFDGAMAAVFERDKMLNGQAAQMVYFYTPDSNSFPSYSMLPADLDGMNTPPAGAPNPIMEMVDDAWGYDPPYDKDEIVIMPLHVDWTDTNNSTFGPAKIIDLTAAGYPFDSSMCGYSRDCIPQPGTSQGLDSMSSRLMYRPQYRNFGDRQSLVVSHTVDVDGSDHAGVRWYELNDTGSGWTIKQAGTYAPDSDHRWMSDIAMDASGDIAVGFSISSSTTYPSVAWAGRLLNDPAGELSQGEAIVVAGAGSQTHSAARWGDYSSMSVDPVDDCTFWYTQEYMPTTGSAPWQTRIAAFKFPSCTTGPTGTVHGKVANSSTNDPIAGATVTFVSGTNNFSTTTAPDGTYSITVPADTYDITASAFGFTQQTVNGLVVGDGDDITQDFALDPAGTAFFDGYVTATGHGWPLYAKVAIATGGSTVATVYTNPFNGYYEVELPQGSNYDFTVTPTVPGYDPMTRTVLLPPAGATVSFEFTPISPTCNAPGYGPGNGTILAEDFEGSFPPAGWTVTDDTGGSGAGVWESTATTGRSNYTGGSGDAADADSDWAGDGMTTTLYSP